MKQFMLTFILLALSPFSLAAQDDTKAVEQAVATLTDAMVSGDAKALMAISSAHLSYGHSGGSIETQEQFVEKIASGKSDFVSINLLKQNVQVVGDIALVRHDLDAKTNDHGKPGEVYLGVLLVWQKSDGQWLLLARQAFKYPH